MVGTRARLGRLRLSLYVCGRTGPEDGIPVSPPIDRAAPGRFGIQGEYVIKMRRRFAVSVLQRALAVCLAPSGPPARVPRPGTGPAPARGGHLDRFAAVVLTIPPPSRRDSRSRTAGGEFPLETISICIASSMHLQTFMSGVLTAHNMGRFWRDIAFLKNHLRPAEPLR